MGHLSFSRPQTEDYIELNILPYACFGHKNGPKRESDLVQSKSISRKFTQPPCFRSLKKCDHIESMCNNEEKSKNNYPSKRSNCQHLLDHLKSKRVPKKHLFLFYWLCQSLWLCESQQTLENSERDGNTRPPYLPLEKSISRSRGNS